MQPDSKIGEPTKVVPLGFGVGQSSSLPVRRRRRPDLSQQRFGFDLTEREKNFCAAFSFDDKVRHRVTVSAGKFKQTFPPPPIVASCASAGCRLSILVQIRLSPCPHHPLQAESAAHAKAVAI